jgi:hypothetical protein
MLSYTAMGTCVLVLTLGTILIIVLVIQKEKSGKGVGTAFLSALIGILIGAGGAAAGVQLLGYDISKVRFADNELDDSDPEALEGAGAGMGGGGMAGGGMPGGGMGGMGGGMAGGGMPGGGMGGMGGGMGGMGGGRGPSAKRQLTTLVRKIDLLTGDIALNLADEQSSQLADLLSRIESQDAMTDEDAKVLHEELLGLLTDEQTAKQEAVSLPFRRGGGGMGGGGQDPDANPFEQEQNGEALSALLQRFRGSENPAPDPDVGTTEEPSVEQTDEPASDSDEPEKSDESS